MAQNKTILAEWTVIPSAAPRPVRHCPTCGQSQDFTSSGRVRLNANGKRLDAWLIYKCIQCDQTWNRPLLDRQLVSQISLADLDAMQHSLPDWVRMHEFDIVALKAHCSRLHHIPDFTIVKRTQNALSEDWSEISLSLKPELPTGLRVDKIICEGWQVSRSHLKKLTKAGNIAVGSERANILKKPLHSDVNIRVLAAGLSEGMQRKLLGGLLGTVPANST